MNIFLGEKKTYLYIKSLIKEIVFKFKKNFNYIKSETRFKYAR